MSPPDNVPRTGRTLAHRLTRPFHEDGALAVLVLSNGRSRLRNLREGVPGPGHPASGVQYPILATPGEILYHFGPMVLRPSYRYALLLLAATAWLGLASFSILPFSKDWAGTPWIIDLFSRICHQNPARSFVWLGNSMAVCHRCFGLYLGFWCGLLLFPFLPSASRFLLRQPRRILLFFLPLVLDVWLDNTVLTRFATGMLAGFPVALFVWLAVEQLSPASLFLSRRLHEPSST